MVASVECYCNIKTVERTSSSPANFNLNFLSCMRSECGFFIWTTQLQEYLLEKEKCLCGHLVRRMTCKRGMNISRTFMCCGRPRSDARNCKLFQWTSPFQEENIALQANLIPINEEEIEESENDEVEVEKKADSSLNMNVKSVKTVREKGCVLAGDSQLVLPHPRAGNSIDSQEEAISRVVDLTRASTSGVKKNGKVRSKSLEVSKPTLQSQSLQLRSKSLDLNAMDGLKADTNSLPQKKKLMMSKPKGEKRKLEGGFISSKRMKVDEVFSDTESDTSDSMDNEDEEEDDIFRMPKVVKKKGKKN